MRVLFLILHLGGIFMFPTTWSYPLDENTVELDGDVLVTEPGNLSSTILDCRSGLILTSDEFLINPSGTAYILDTKRILKPSEYVTVDGNLCIIEPENDETTTSLSPDCDMWYFEPEEFTILPNGSVFMYNEILEKDAYEMEGDRLKKCVDDYDYENITIPSDPTREALIYMGQIGASISIISLFLHLLIFALVPARRNFPGYNLASLSVAFLLGYFFLLFGQIPSVLGTSCVVSASLQHFFFLAGFFWMNVISFDVWRCLRLATTKFLAPSGESRKLRFLCYSIYAWGIPMCLAVTAVVIDLCNEVNDEYKPFFGRHDICWFTNEKAKSVYFAIPVIMLIVLNTIFFILSAVMIVTNTISNTSDQQRSAERNVTLYARLALVMGIIWLTAIAGMVFQRQELWIVFDALNSLQGFFVFMFFSFSRVWHFFRNKGKLTSADSAKSSTIKNSTTRSASESRGI